VEDVQYEVAVGKTDKAHAYRFVNPKNPLAPLKIKIATRQMDELKLRGDAQRLNEFDISAIVCAPIYINHLKTNSTPTPLSGALAAFPSFLSIVYRVARAPRAA